MTDKFKKHFNFFKLGIVGKHGDSFLGISGLIMASCFLVIIPLFVSDTATRIIFPLIGIGWLWVLYQKGKQEG